MKDRNYIPATLLFFVLTAVIFSALSFVNFEGMAVGLSLKQVGLFADIQTDAEEIAAVYPKTDTPAKVTKKTTTVAGKQIPDSVRFGQYVKYYSPDSTVSIENYTAQEFPLDHIFSRLGSDKKFNNKVRIAWFGDSFTDCDLIVGDMRDTLQSVYGGNGVGFMPITHEAPGFRRSVVHAFSGWRTSSMSAAKGSYNLGINGHAYRPDSASYVYFAGSNRYKHTRNFDSFNLYYTSSQPVAARLLVNDTIRRQVEMKNSSLPAKISFGINNIRKVRLNVPSVAGVVLFGASLEDSTGIYIDNFSVKGNSGLGLLAIPDRNLARFDSLLNYDLIVLQFGLNAVDAKTRDYSAYMQGMKKLVGKFRRTFPGTPILLMSVSDRSERVQGKYVTMKSIKGLVAEQQKFAANNQLLFWNLFEAMGGDNSMAKLVASKPPLANKDYTHLNFQGSRVLGVRFARSFIYEGKKYLMRTENQVSSNHTQAVGNAVL